MSGIFPSSKTTWSVVLEYTQKFNTRKKLALIKDMKAILNRVSKPSSSNSIINSLNEISTRKESINTTRKNTVNNRYSTFNPEYAFTNMFRLGKKEPASPKIFLAQFFQTLPKKIIALVLTTKSTSPSRNGIHSRLPSWFSGRTNASNIIVNPMNANQATLFIDVKMMALFPDRVDSPVRFSSFLAIK
ncbi:MAG: hypothetical protein HOI65_05430 [Opitutae bacterium]|nr:hypothetical protein [Opitutae bacterium]MBT5380683.1 hypothetical protein [Opitutae bacterium]MBT5690540.1 hypothetical protein [Opitutae bacterium]